MHPDLEIGLVSSLDVEGERVEMVSRAKWREAIAQRDQATDALNHLAQSFEAILVVTGMRENLVSQIVANYKQRALDASASSAA